MRESSSALCCTARSTVSLYWAIALSMAASLPWYLRSQFAGIEQRQRHDRTDPESTRVGLEEAIESK